MNTSSKPFWINPCNRPLTSGDDSQTYTPEREVILQPIEIVRLAAHVHANELLEKYAQQEFRMNASSVHDLFKEQPNWIDPLLRKLSIEPLPKGLHESVSEEYLETLEFPNILLDMYTHLQIIAAGVEQLISETNLQDSDSSQLRQKLQALLCELQDGILSLNLKMRSDVTRDDVPSDNQSYDTTKRRATDWILLRDYVNALEYLEQVFRHMRQVQ